MTAIIKCLLAVVVILVLAGLLSALLLYALYMLLIICLFYRPMFFFIAGALYVAFATWLAIMIFRFQLPVPDICKVEDGLRYEPATPKN